MRKIAYFAVWSLMVSLLVATPQQSFSSAVPSAPLIVQMDTSTSGQITVDFTRPYDGGSAITDYEYSTDNGSTWVSFGSTGQSLTVSGLTDGTRYDVKVRAVNGVGNGAASLKMQGVPAGVRAPFDVTSAVRYDSAGGPIGSVVTDITNNDDDSTTIASPFKLNFFGQTMEAICLTTNGTLYPVSTTSDGCSDNYDQDLKALAESGSAPIIAALANDADPGNDVITREASLAHAANNAGTLEFETTKSGLLTAGSSYCVFIAADNIDNGQTEASEPTNQIQACGTVAGAGASWSISSPSVTSGFGAAVSLPTFAYATNLIGYVSSSTRLDEQSDGFGTVAELYQGTVDLAGTPLDASDDSFVYTAYRVPQYDDENSQVLTNTWQIVLTPDLSSGNATTGYGFDIEYNYGSIQDEDDGYDGDDPSSSCSSGELICRTGIGTADYDADTSTGDPYELFADTPWRNLMDWGQTASMTRNSLNSSVLGRYTFTFSGTTGKPTNFAVPVMDGTGTTTARPGDDTPAPASSNTSAKKKVEDPVPVAPVSPPVAAPREREIPGLVREPIQTGNRISEPPAGPTATVGGRAVELVRSVPTPQSLVLSSGRLALNLSVGSGQGSVRESADGVTEIQVTNGSEANLAGSGFYPGSTLQLFVPVGSGEFRELSRISVDASGSFDGAATFAGGVNQAPLPIGKRLLQLVSVDEDGNRVVVEMAVNIAQGAPAPEQNRIDGVIPTMAPGQSVATSGGEPVPVRITPVAEQKLAVVEGDGWTMAVNVSAEDGGVEPSEGGALLKLVRDESAVISGSGFMPGTRADVWLFSDPTLLGTVTIDENGEFTGEVNIDPNMIPVGEHTLQLQGVGEDGYVKAANLGVLVDDAVEAVPTAVEQGLGFIWWIIAALVLLAVIVVLIASRRRKEA